MLARMRACGTLRGCSAYGRSATRAYSVGLYACGPVKRPPRPQQTWLVGRLLMPCTQLDQGNSLSSKHTLQPISNS